jgi:hypothetical protein
MEIFGMNCVKDVLQQLPALFASTQIVGSNLISPVKNRLS